MSDQLTQLVEEIDLAEVTQDNVDEENGVIRGVRILGKYSKNGREYTEQARRDAAKCYEGVGVNVDHKRKPGEEHKLLEGKGWLGECADNPAKEAVYGNLYILKTDPDAPKIFEIARRKPKNIGLSHVAEGVTKSVGGKTIVESIQRVTSVDLVRNPATNSSLFESEDLPVSKKPFKQFVEAIEGDSAEKKALTSLIESDAKIGALEIEEAEFTSPLFKALQTALVESADKLAKAGEKKPDPTVESLQARLDAYEAKDGARKLLESAGVTATEAKISAVAALGSKADKDALVKEFKESVQAPSPRKPNSGSALHESQGGNQSYEELTKGGFAKAL